MFRAVRLPIIRSYSKQVVQFPGAPLSQYTEELKVDRDWPVLPTYRVIDKEGLVLNKSQEPKVFINN